MFPKRMFPLFLAMAGIGFAADPSLPAPSELPVHPGLPDLLTASGGKRVETKEQWEKERAPELRRLVLHYEYGVQPARPRQFEAKLLRTDKEAFGGKATLKELEVRCTEPNARVHLLIVVPNKREKAAPCFLGMNFNGNHALLNDPLVQFPSSWTTPPANAMPRGKELEAWNLEKTIDRGYAVATFYSGDVLLDKAEVALEKLKQLVPPGKSAGDADAPATIGTWAWGFSRMIDYLVTDADIDAGRIAAVGHSRNGKTALLAAAMDPRIALVIPSQAGCGGTAPCRMAPELAALQANGRPSAETVAVINKNFPHWFCANFKQFNGAVEKLPFDQHALVALCAPRPVLFSTATEDLWSNPSGQFDMLRAADPVYRLVSGEGIEAKTLPEPGKLVDSRLGYFIRPGKH
ncbi:MAG: acetylxylan esterase, partial [Verrucomicrobiota bacterium]